MATIAELDARLLVALATYHGHLNAGELVEADLAYKRLDQLLDQRVHIPQPRTP